MAWEAPAFSRPVNRSAAVNRSGIQDLREKWDYIPKEESLCPWNGHCKKHKVWVFLVAHAGAFSQWGEEWEKEALFEGFCVHLSHQKCVWWHYPSMWLNLFSHLKQKLWPGYRCHLGTQMQLPQHIPAVQRGNKGTAFRSPGTVGTMKPSSTHTDPQDKIAWKPEYAKIRARVELQEYESSSEVFHICKVSKCSMDLKSSWLVSMINRITYQQSNLWQWPPLGTAFNSHLLLNLFKICATF